jgi:nucleoid-associated protein YgaU
MEKLAMATIVVMWQKKKPKQTKITVQHNPTEFTLDKGVQVTEVPVPGLDAPLLQFVRGKSETLTVDLFFDTTDSGMGQGAKSVSEKTDEIYSLMKIEPGAHTPPICAFMWNAKFPGSNISDETGGQRREAFQCIVESVKQKFTLFSPEGVPLRAVLTLTLKEYKTLHEQHWQLNLNSPDRTQAHVVARGDTLSSIAGEHYRRPSEWRRIASENGITDPRRLATGVVLDVPPIRSAGSRA